MKAWVVGAASVVALALGGAGFVLASEPNETAAIRADGPSGSIDLAAEGGAIQVTTSTATTATTAGSGPVTTQSANPLQAPAVPECTVGDAPVTVDPLTGWATVVVDAANRLEPDFVPPDLVPVSQAGFRNEADLVRQIVIADLGAMRQAAEDAGTPFVVVSAFRDYEYQRQLFDGMVAAEGMDAAIATTAQPGHSEHQLGTTIDVLNPESSELTTEFGATPAGRWVEEHGHEYGFVQSYPSGTREQTCYDYEPWHIRYVGRDIAGRIHASGQTPREWLLAQAPPAG